MRDTLHRHHLKLILLGVFLCSAAASSLEAPPDDPTVSLLVQLMASGVTLWKAVAAVAVLLVLEAWLGATDRVQPNSTLGALAVVLRACGRGLVALGRRAVQPVRMPPPDPPTGTAPVVDITKTQVVDVSKVGALLPLLAGAALLLSACATSPFDRARQTLTALEDARAAGEKALTDYNAPHQRALVAEVAARCGADATCVERDGQAALAAWRGKVDVAVHAFIGARGAVAAAKVAIDVAEIAHQPGATADGIVGALLPAVRPIVTTLSALGIAPPGLAALVGGP